MIEDMKSVKDLALEEWSRIYWERVKALIEERKKTGGSYSIQRFKDLEASCLQEYRSGNARNLLRAKKQIRAGDESFAVGIERMDACFRMSLSGMKDPKHREEHIKVREERRNKLLRDWRIRKRVMMDKFYELEAHSDKAIFDDVDSLRYEDFCAGGRSAMSGCFLE